MNPTLALGIRFRITNMLRIDLGNQDFDFKTLELQCDETFRPTRLRMEAGLWSVDLVVVRN